MYENVAASRNVILDSAQASEVLESGKTCFNMASSLASDSISVTDNLLLILVKVYQLPTFRYLSPYKLSVIDFSLFVPVQVCQLQTVS